MTTCLVAFRGYVRWTVFHRFFADDALVLLAYILLSAGVMMWQVNVQTLYNIFGVITGAVHPPPADFFLQFGTFIHTAFASLWLIILGLWAVKFSFLLFFKQLGQNVKGQKVLWWCVFMATCVGLIITIGLMNYECGTKPAEYVLSTSTNA